MSPIDFHCKVDFGAIFKITASENRIYLILIITERQNNIFKVHKYNGNIIWPIVAFCRFFKMAVTENTIKYITLIVIYLYKQTWCQNIYFEGPEIQWRCFEVDRICMFASQWTFGLFS